MRTNVAEKLCQPFTTVDDLSRHRPTVSSCERKWRHFKNKETVFSCIHDFTVYKIVNAANAYSTIVSFQDEVLGRDRAWKDLRLLFYVLSWEF